MTRASLVADLAGLQEVCALKEARDPELQIDPLSGRNLSPSTHVIILPVQIPLYVLCKVLAYLPQKIPPTSVEAYEAGIGIPIFQMRKQAQGSDLLLLKAPSLVCGRAWTKTWVS